MKKLLSRYVAVIMLLVVVGSVIFNWWSPWWFTEIASNWKFIDFTVFVTFWICGIVFVILGVFMSWSLWKYKYREDARAEYEPENAKLESWLTGITTIGVVVMLSPGLIVWDDYVNVPPDAMEVEVVGEQWTWRYRFPGEDGVFGVTRIENVDTFNPLGMGKMNGELDPAGEDDVIIATNTFYLPINRNVKVLLRSKDVLHDFWVPEIRAKMDMVPGMITYFWFEPTVEGKYEVLCAELCGRGHHAMRGVMHIVSEADFAKWLDAQPTWAEMKAGKKPEDPLVTEGRLIAESNGCFACHSMDGSQVVGPTWQNLWGRTVTLTDDTTLVADEAYIVESITHPNEKMVKGFSPVMTPYELSEDDMAALLYFLKETDPNKPVSEPQEELVEQVLLESAESNEETIGNNE